MGVFLKKILIGFFAVCVFVFVAVFGVGYFVSLGKYQEFKAHTLTSIEGYNKPFLADLKVLTESPLISNLGYSQNAEELFASHVSWQGSGIEPLADESHQRLRAFFQRYQGWSKSPETFQKMLRDPELDLIDTSWLAQVHNYDHWSILANAYVAPHLERVKQADSIARVGIFASLPIPYYSELYDFATAHLLQMHKKHKTIEGLKVYRKTAELVYSSSLLVSAMVAVKFFKNEKFLVENLAVKNWKTPPQESIDAFKRVSWAWVAILKNSFYSDIEPEIAQYIKVENGICGASFEAVMNDAIASDYLSPRAPFEIDHSAELARLSSTEEKFRSLCHMESLKVFSGRTPASVNTWIPKNEALYVTEGNTLSYLGILGYLNLSKVPYVRRMFGYVLVSFSEPDYFKQYKNLSKRD